MSSIQVVVHASAKLLADAAAARLITRVVDIQSARGFASIVLTGGSTGIAVLEAIKSTPARGAIDWKLLDIWWGDERYVEAASKDRNDIQAFDALLDSVPVEPDRVHRFPASDGEFGDDAESAAEWYAEELVRATKPEDHGQTPHFDVLMSGLGEEGHTASIFPESPAAYDERMVCAVRNCPKPPPTRLTMTFQALSRAAEVWMMATDAGKAAAVGMALRGAGPVQLPAAGPQGSSRTLWLLDSAAAADVPKELIRLPIS